MEKVGALSTSGMQLTLLPGFADFILSNHRDEFLRYSREKLLSSAVPLITRLNADEAHALADKSNMELLTSLAKGSPAPHIERAIDRWRTEQFPRAQRNHFVVEDVTKIGHIRKLSFLQFLPRYTKDVEKIISICEEIDQYILDYTSGALHSFVGIIDDRIHEHVEHLERRTKELQESNASLEEFAYAASHDLKEPLRKISVYIQMLGEQIKWPGEREAKWYERIVASTNRMTHLIDDLLSLSLLSTTAKPEAHDLSMVLAEAMQILEQRIEDSKTKVLSSDLPAAKVIRSQFVQLFQNLLSNSIKFAKPGVAPEIEVTHRLISPEEAVNQFDLMKTAYLEITFSDNGIGFNDSHNERIFAVFQRLHNKDEYDGTGIGLAICRKIVKNHSGLIIARGVEGVGAKFSVIIPAV